MPASSPSGSSWGQYVVRGGLMYSQGKLCVPPTSAALILKPLQECHDSPLAGHYGVARTEALLAQYYTWPGLAGAVAKYVGSCDTCARSKVVRHAPYGLLSPLPILSRPWSSVFLDWITDLPPSHYHDAILVVVDRSLGRPTSFLQQNSW